MIKIKKLTFFMFVLLFTASLGLAGCAQTKETPQAPADNAEALKPFGTFTSKTLKGEAITEDVFSHSSVSMVNIWGTFCGPCINELPDLGNLSREYPPEDFQIIGLLCDVAAPEDATALDIIAQTQADYTHIVASEDLQKNILSQVQGVPTTIFVDSKGQQLGKTYVGARSYEEWKSLIESLKE